MTWLSDLFGKTIKVDNKIYPDRNKLSLLSGESADVKIEDNDGEKTTDVTISVLLPGQPEGTELVVQGYQLNAALLVGSFDVSVEDGTPTGVFFRPDGTRMFIVGGNGDSVYQYDLSTAWDVTTAVFDDSFDVSAQESFPASLAFRDDGTRMFIVGGNGDSVYQYDLSTAWDVTTATFVSSFDVSVEDGTPTGVFFRPDGLRMFLSGSGNNNVYQYDLSTSWDVTTATFVSSFDVSPQDTGPAGVFFHPDGLRMFLVGGSSDSVHQYDLSTAWDVTTATFVSSFDVSPQDTNPYGLFFQPNGARMFVVGRVNTSVFSYLTNRIILGPA